MKVRLRRIIPIHQQTLFEMLTPYIIISIALHQLLQLTIHMLQLGSEFTNLFHQTYTYWLFVKVPF